MKGFAILTLGLPLAAALCGCMATVSSDTTMNRAMDAAVAVVAERDPTAGLQSINKDGKEVWRRKLNYSEQTVRGGVSVTTEQVRLEPGRYQIVSLLWCTSTYAYESSGFRNGNYLGLRHTDEVELSAGHVYEIRGQNTGYLCGDGPKLWIEDATAGGTLKAISSDEQAFPR